jgi:hypothetical protein
LGAIPGAKPVRVEPSSRSSQTLPFSANLVPVSLGVLARGVNVRSRLHGRAGTLSEIAQELCEDHVRGQAHGPAASSARGAHAPVPACERSRAIGRQPPKLLICRKSIIWQLPGGRPCWHEAVTGRPGRRAAGLGGAGPGAAQASSPTSRPTSDCLVPARPSAGELPDD